MMFAFNLLSDTLQLSHSGFLSFYNLNMVALLFHERDHAQLSLLSIDKVPYCTYLNGGAKPAIFCFSLTSHSFQPSHSSSISF
jgi:hypothetical protein